MATTPNTPETANQAALTQPPNTNEEILKLLRQLVGQDSSANEQGEPKPEASSEVTPEVKRLLEELLKQKSTPANDDETEDEDVDDEANADLDTLNDDEDDDEYTDDDLETVGYIVGGAALVGAGALLYHLLRKL